jgi:deoxyribonuclease-4
MLIGAHISISKGISKSILIGKELGCNTIQMFTKNSVQWKMSELNEKEIKDFKKNKLKSEIDPIIAHDSYLINLSSPRIGILNKSRNAFLKEMERCHILGIPYLITHPGSHTAAGEKEGLRILKDSMDFFLNTGKILK